MFNHILWTITTKREKLSNVEWVGFQIEWGAIPFSLTYSENRSILISFYLIKPSINIYNITGLALISFVGYQAVVVGLALICLGNGVVLLGWI